MPHYFNTECFLNGYLEVSTDASIYYELSGNRRGTPVLFLHGGPGAGLPQNYLRFFDPEHWMVEGFEGAVVLHPYPHYQTTQLRNN